MPSVFSLAAASSCPLKVCGTAWYTEKQRDRDGAVQIWTACAGPIYIGAMVMSRHVRRLRESRPIRAHVSCDPSHMLRSLAMNINQILASSSSSQPFVLHVFDSDPKIKKYIYYKIKNCGNKRKDISHICVHPRMAGLITGIGWMEGRWRGLMKRR